MNDKIKLVFAVVLLVVALMLPLLVGGLVGTYQWLNRTSQTSLGFIITTSALVSMATFLVFFVIAVVLLYRIDYLPWIGASLPYLFSAVYSASLVDLIPDLMPLVSQIDDGTVMAFGSVFSYLLALRRDSKTPRWIFIPLIVAAIYTFFGGLLPGPIDEIVVQMASYLLFILGSSRNPLRHKEEKAKNSKAFTREVLEDKINTKGG